MKAQKSETMKEIFPMNRILAVAGLSSAAYYRKKPAEKEKAHRGPKPKIRDEDLLPEIRVEILNSMFTDEGYEKIWKRLRNRGIKASAQRVNQLMLDNNLLSTTLTMKSWLGTPQRKATVMPPWSP